MEILSLTALVKLILPSLSAQDLTEVLHLFRSLRAHQLSPKLRVPTTTKMMISSRNSHLTEVGTFREVSILQGEFLNLVVWALFHQTRSILNDPFVDKWILIPSEIPTLLAARRP
jgi:hypothetical protein